MVRRVLGFAETAILPMASDGVGLAIGGRPHNAPDAVGHTKQQLHHCCDARARINLYLRQVAGHVRRGVAHPPRQRIDVDGGVDGARQGHSHRRRHVIGADGADDEARRRIKVILSPKAQWPAVRACRVGGGVATTAPAVMAALAVAIDGVAAATLAIDRTDGAAPAAAVRRAEAEGACAALQRRDAARWQVNRLRPRRICSINHTAREVAARAAAAADAAAREP
eukprot:4231161-Prymnesium_polylepis.1